MIKFPHAPGQSEPGLHPVEVVAGPSFYMPVPEDIYILLQTLELLLVLAEGHINSKNIRGKTHIGIFVPHHIYATSKYVPSLMMLSPLEHDENGLPLAEKKKKQFYLSHCQHTFKSVGMKIAVSSLNKDSLLVRSDLSVNNS